MDLNKFYDYEKGYNEGLEDAIKAYDKLYEKSKHDYINWLIKVLVSVTALCFIIYGFFGTNGIIDRLMVTSQTPYRDYTVLDELFLIIAVFNILYAKFVKHITNKGRA